MKLISFICSLDYAAMLYRHNLIGLDGCHELKLQQEEKPSNLLAVGKLSKDTIELTVENCLREDTGDADLEVIAELFENTTDKWRIDTGHEGQQKSGISTLSIISIHTVHV